MINFCRVKTGNLKIGKGIKRSKQLFKTKFIIFKSEFGNNVLDRCKYDETIVFVLENINFNKVHVHRNISLNKILVLLSYTENSTV